MESTRRVTRKGTSYGTIRKRQQAAVRSKQSPVDRPDNGNAKRGAVHSQRKPRLNNKSAYDV